MVKSAATTVDEYLKTLPEERREVISAIRDLIQEHLPAGYRERVNWGMISYEIPLERYTNTYNGQPLGYIALAAQKNYNVLYLMGAYMEAGRDGWLRREFEKAGKKFDMGKSCLRFRTLDDLPLDVIARVVASTPPDKFIASYEEARGPAKSSRKRAVKKTVRKRSAKRGDRRLT
jgi:hypothetical protein